MNLKGILTILLALCLLTCAPLALADDIGAEERDEIGIEAVDPDYGETEPDNSTVEADAPAYDIALSEASADTIDIGLATIEGVEDRVYTGERSCSPSS